MDSTEIVDSKRKRPKCLILLSYSQRVNDTTRHVGQCGRSKLCAKLCVCFDAIVT